jgi:hypothetical protein
MLRNLAGYEILPPGNRTPVVSRNQTGNVEVRRIRRGSTGITELRELRLLLSVFIQHFNDGKGGELMLLKLDELLAAVSKVIFKKRIEKLNKELKEELK